MSAASSPPSSDPSPLAAPRAPAETGAWRWTAVLLLAPLFWGAAFPTIKFTLGSLSPMEVATLRIVGAALVLAALAPWLRPERLRLRDVPLVALVGLLGFPAYQYLTNVGLRTAPAGAGSFLTALVPLFAALFALWWFREPLGRLAWIGIPTAMAGVWVIVTGHGGRIGTGNGFAALLAASLVAGLYFALEGRLMRRYRAGTVLSYSLWIGAVALLPTLDGAGAALHTAPHGALGALGFLILFPTLVAFGAMAWGLGRAKTAEATSFIFLIPVFAFLVAWPLLGERPLWTDLVGGAVVIAGVWLVSRSRRAVQHMRAPAAPPLAAAPQATTSCCTAARPEP